MEDLVKQWTAYFSAGLEASAGIIIGFAAIEATLRAFKLFIFRRRAREELNEIRLQLGQWLALGLEFELGADILQTAIAPSWTEIGQLAAIAILRTVLNFFLQKEIEQADEKKRLVHK